MKLNYHRQMVRKVLQKLGIGKDCIDCAVRGNEGQDSLLNQDRTDFHFDGCDFAGGIEYVQSQLQEIERLRTEDCSKNICKIFEAFGRLTHGIQDFYAHSNWVELGNREIWDLETIPDNLCSGIWILSNFECKIEGKTCPRHAVLLHDEIDISKDSADRRNFGKAIRLAYKHTRSLARELKRQLGDDCLKACN